MADTSLGGNQISECRNNRKNNYCHLDLDKGTFQFDDPNEEQKKVCKPVCFPREKASQRSHLKSTKYLVWPEGNGFMMSETFK